MCQDDILFAFMTVREVFLVATHFQLGWTISRAQKEVGEATTDSTPYTHPLVRSLARSLGSWWFSRQADG